MDELGKSIPVAEAAVDAEQGTDTRKPHNENCLNCGMALQDIYCHHCGQKDLPRRQTLGELFSNFISSFWSYEGKFFRTTRYLITKPGFLSTEYNAGRRESYYHPARMYVFISFVFFLLLISLPDEEDPVATFDPEDLEELREDLKEEGLDTVWHVAGLSDSALLLRAPALQDSLTKRKGDGVQLGGVAFLSVQEYDSLEKIKPESERDGWLERAMNIRSIELNNRYRGRMDTFGEEFTQMFVDNFSKVLFYLLPLFALVFKLLYVRRDFFYSEHLVFSIYYYNFFFLAASAVMLVDLVPYMGWLATLLGFWIYFYLLFAMKQAYGQSWRKTILKFVIFSFIFSFLMVLGISISAMIILMTI